MIFMLRVCGGPTLGALYPLTENETRIGRDSQDCHIVLPAEAESVSRLHVSLHLDRQAGTVILREEGSKNGTWIDGVGAIEPGEELPIAVGTRFRLGEASIAFELLAETTPVIGDES